MWSLARAAHFVKANCPNEIWIEFLRSFATTEQYEILASARGKPGDLLEWKQGRASLTWELGVIFDRADELWHVIEEAVKKQEEEERARSQSNSTVNGGAFPRS